jgi:hypothetical protein
MQDVQHIENGGVTYALIFGRNLPVTNDVRFPTCEEDSLQVGFFERDTGYVSLPHRHAPRSINLKHIAEFLSIEKGEVAVTVFDESWNVVGEQIVGEGHCIVFLRGGHSIKIRKPTRILEVKQGPYGGNDKILRDA